MNRNLIIGLLAVVAAAHISVPAWMIWRHESVLSGGRQYKFRTAPVDPADPFRGRYVALRLEATTAPIPAEPSVENLNPVMSADAQDLPRGMKVYALLKEDTDGFARFAGISYERPKEGDYIQAPISRAQDYASYTRRWDAPQALTTETLTQTADRKTAGTTPQVAARREAARKQAMERKKDPRSNNTVVTLELPFTRYYMEENVAPHAEKAYWSRSTRQARDSYVTVRVKSGDAVIENLFVGGRPIGEVAREEMKKEEEKAKEKGKEGAKAK